MSRLSDIIYQSHDIPEQIVDVPEWGVSLLIRGLDGESRARYLERYMTSDMDGSVTIDYGSMYPAILVETCFDPDDNSLVFEGEADMAKINKKSAAVIERLAKIASELSGLTQDAEKKAAQSFHDGAGEVPAVLDS